MPDDATAVQIPAGHLAETEVAGAAPNSTGSSTNGAPTGPVGVHMRLLHGMRHPQNWLQLMRFCIVGASGFAINLVVYRVAYKHLGIDYLAAAAGSWIIAAASNFYWNRHWTFKARDGLVHHQALRFLVVSLVALAIDLAVLSILVQTGGLDKLVAQVLALAVATPANFIGNKLWSFRPDIYSDGSPPQEK
jgi:putative flippase GtrA